MKWAAGVVDFAACLGDDEFMNITDQTDVVIVGGGLNGPALALALAQAGLRVTVVDARQAEARAEVGFDGRAYALALASQRLLTAVGVWPVTAQPILQVVASDGRAGEGASPFALHFDAAEIEDGPMGFMVEDRHLYAGFLAAMAAQPAIRLLSGQTVVAQDAGQVTLASGAVLRARLVVGLDWHSSSPSPRDISMSTLAWPWRVVGCWCWWCCIGLDSMHASSCFSQTILVGFSMCHV